MKKHSFIHSFILILIAFNLFGQTDSYLYVYPKHISAYPASNANSNVLTGDSQINQIFTNYSVISYQQSFPGADASSTIANAYEIYLDGDMTNFANALWSMGKFSVIHDAPGYELATCPNPVQVNDPKVVSYYNDPSNYLAWQLESVDAPCAWSVTTGDPNITVAVIDTEFNENHLDLVDNLVYHEPGMNFQGPHGTPVAGQVAATPNNGKYIAGIGYNTTIAGYVVRGFDENGNDLNTGSLWRNMWDAFLDGRPVINVSWTGINNGSITLSDGTFINTRLAAAQYITEHGTVIVVAGGNNLGSLNSHSEYSNVPGVINVAWLDRDEVLGDPNNRPYSQFNDLVAPAGFMHVLQAGGWSDWGRGTSFAAPIVAGTAALMLDVNDCITPAEIEGIIKNTTDPVSNGHIAPHGTGKLNSYKAVKFAAGYTTYINDTKEWTAPAHLSGDLIVESGGQLTIKEQVRVAPDAKIIVKPNGRLILDGGVLTTDCSGERWEGVIVEGNTDESQDYNIYTQSRAQGYFRMRNNAVIEHAIYGVRLYDPFNGNMDDHGGIIIATDSEIRNCAYGVDFAPYTNISIPAGNQKSNLSSFKNCVFTVDSDMLDDGEDFVSHVSMRGITGLRFLACTFLNDTPLSFQAGVEERGQGIKALDSEFKVLPVCSQAIPQGESCDNYFYSEFRGLQNGILSGNKSGINTFRVDRANFLGNHFGIAGYSSDNCSITRCDFSVGLDASTQTNPYTGVLLHGAAGFKLEENRFSGFDFTVSDAQSVGTVIRNSGNEINQVYKNYYDGLDFANVANGDNKGVFGDDGLVYFCNENGETTDNGYDFAVPSTDVIDSGIAKNQGNADLPSGNTFSSTLPNPFTHFFNELEDIEYFYEQGATGEMPTGYTDATIEITSTLSVNFCSSKLPDDREREFANEDDKNAAIATMNGGTSTANGNYAYSRLLRDLKADTTGIAYEDVRSMLRGEGNYEALCDLVDCYLQEKSALFAANVLDSIEIQLTLNTEEADRYTDFDALKKMQIQAEINGTSFADFISQNATELDAIAAKSYGVAPTQALYLLNYAQIERFGKFNHPRIILPETRAEERLEKEDMRSVKSSNIFPNPAKNHVTFEYFLSDDAELSVFSYSGRTINTILLNKEKNAAVLNTENLPTGIYFYLITKDGDTLEKGKFSIIK